MSQDPLSLDPAPRLTLEPRITVAAYSTSWEAQLGRARLEAAGIEASLADEHTIRLAWMFSMAVGGVKLQVRAEDRAAAEDALAHAEPLPEIYLVEEGERIEAHRCPGCGSAELVYRRWSLPAFVGSWLLLGFPVPILWRRWSCRACGAAWKAEDLAD